MAKNDVVLLDGLIEERLINGDTSDDVGEQFELFVLQEVLKDYDVSKEDLDAGWVDGADDGGIDAFYILVNGNLIDDVVQFQWPRTDASMEVWLFTCKHHATFLQAPLDLLVATVQELFDLSIPTESLSGRYSSDLLELRSAFATTYKRLSVSRPALRFRIVYASRGDTECIGDSVEARARQLEQIISDLFSDCACEFRFVGASELVQMHRRVKTFALELPFIEHLATGRDSHVLLAKLDDYRRFVTDEDGQLRRYLFDSNVRDYLGSNQVNEDILRSLSAESAPDFWWLNNGVTILTTNATVTGKTLQLQDIQIVNGLQTTETLFRYFSTGGRDPANRSLLVKVLASTDDQVRDHIIRATNNQSPVEVAALRATDKVQRDIEQILEKSGWYYERRKNYYRNVNKPEGQLVSPLYLASAVVALVLKNPARASKLKSRFMRNSVGYETVFSAQLPIAVWPALVRVFKDTERGLASIGQDRRRGSRFISQWRGLVALIAVAKHFGTFAYRVSDFAEAHIDVAGEVRGIWELIEEVLPHTDWQGKPKPSVVKGCCAAAAERFGLLGRDDVGRRGIPYGESNANPARMPQEFVDRVNMVLPSQPWKPGVHRELAAKLNCKPSDVTNAIQQLIVEGKRYEQRDGIVYGADGAVVAVDAERVAETVEELNSL